MFYSEMMYFTMFIKHVFILFPCCTKALYICKLLTLFY